MKDCECLSCGQHFRVKDRRSGKYCCRACYLKSFNAKAVVSCRGCGEDFQPSPSDRHGRTFCSHRCYLSFSVEENHSCYNPDAELRNCRNCDLSFRSTPSDNRIFCGTKCRNQHRQQYPKNGFAECPQCSGKFRRMKHGQEFCSPECSINHAVGDKSHAWSGGQYQSDIDGRNFVYQGQKQRGRSQYNLLHRLVGESAIGRRLTSDEKVWHIDRDKTNVSIDNLYIFRSQSELSRSMGQDQLPTQSNIESYK